MVKGGTLTNREEPRELMEHRSRIALRLPCHFLREAVPGSWGRFHNAEKDQSLLRRNMELGLRERMMSCAGLLQAGGSYAGGRKGKGT